MVNIVIPMAGLGSRFAKAGYDLPKPFIDIAGKPMIERVLDNLNMPGAKFILIARDEHIEKYPDHINSIEQNYNAEVFSINGLTQGTACTVLLARRLIYSKTPMVIANSDQIVDIAFKDFLDDALNRQLDGSILTFLDESRNPKWSFAKLNDKDQVIEVREKMPISDHATVGIYFFKSGIDFVEAAVDMMLSQDTINGEYYTCPVYNYLLCKQLLVGIYEIDANKMHGIGTPEDLNIYLSKSSENNL